MNINTTDIPETVRRDYQRLCFLAGQGDQDAERQLAELEARIEATARQRRRTEAAEAEAAARAAEAEQRRQDRERQTDERRHQKLMAEKTAAYRQVEKLTAELASAVRVAIEAESLARALCIRLEIHAGHDEALRI